MTKFIVIGSRFPRSISSTPDSKNVIVIESKKVIQINGVCYERISVEPKSEAKKGFIHELVNPIFFIDPYGNVKKPKPLPTQNLEQEFELIQQKKSKLSRSDRDRIEAAFFKIYKAIQ